MCTGRIDLGFVLRAFSRGADGVLIAGCRLNECNYVTHGNFYALSMTNLSKKLLHEIGLSPERMHMELISGGEGNRFADVVNWFSETIRNIGPLGRQEGLDEKDLHIRLDNLQKLVPYIKIAEREKLSLRLNTEEEYRSLYSDAEVHGLLRDVPSYYIDPDKCRACGMCAKRCPVDAIDGGKNRIHVVDQASCIKCGSCREVCPPLFGAVTRISGRPAPAPIAEEDRTIARKKPKMV